MPRVYTLKGERRRAEAITALFTKEEKRRIFEAALSQNITVSIYVSRVVLATLEAA